MDAVRAAEKLNTICVENAKINENLFQNRQILFSIVKFCVTRLKLNLRDHADYDEAVNSARMQESQK